MVKTEPGGDTIQKVEKVVADYKANRDSLISILQDIQSEYHYLPEEALRHVAKCLELPLIQVYGVATFFRAFSMTPRGEHIVSVCLARHATCAERQQCVTN